jgi:methionyl-tRNA formyltransferase
VSINGMRSDMRLGFAGTPPFAAVALGHLLNEGFEPVVVLTQPDRPAGRGQKLTPSAVKQLAVERSLNVLQPTGLKLDGRHAAQAAAARAVIDAARLDALVVVAYGLILPPWLLTAPRLGCFNIHASLLPRWRGAAPIQRAIEAGDTETGITIMQMDAGLDTGPMLARGSQPITPSDTAQTVHDRLAPLGAQLMVQVLRDAQAGRLNPLAQPTEGVTYAAKIDKGEARLDWHDDAQTLEHRVRAFDPQPGCGFEHRGEVWKLWRARVVARPPEVPAQPGHMHLSSATMGVVCGDGRMLDLLEVQRPGGRRISAAQALAASNG